MRPMDHDMIARHLENLDRRLAKVEQFLPTLANKEELQAAIAPLATKEDLQAAIAPLATKEDLQAAIAPLATKEDLRAAIAPLATKEDLQAAIAPLATKEELREDGERSRRHMDVLGESLRGDIHLLAEHLSGVMSRLTDN